MSQSKHITRETYVRKLPYSVIHQLCRYLDPQGQWKMVAENLCLPTEYTEPRYTPRDIAVIDQIRDSCTNALLQDWGTLNSTVGALIDALVKTRRYDAADYLCQEVLKIGRAPRLPEDEDTEETQLVKQFLGMGSPSGSSAGAPTEGIDPQPDADLNDGNRVQAPVNRFLPVSQETRYTVFPHKEVKEITNHFNEMPRSQGGNLVGKGGFGMVFYGKILPGGEEVAVKRLNDDDTVKKQFETEIETMLRFHHENILPIRGFSRDGPYCILYAFMSMGSVEDRLTRKDQTQPLTVMQRVDIAKGTARGIAYLHTAFDKPMVHRDIKSANILLNSNLQPKIGDFGFAHIGAHGNRTATVVVTDNVIGTGAYMAPEAIQTRDVSVKLDTYSYGVILLELLTGLKAYDTKRSEQMLRDHVLENDEVDYSPIQWVDKTAGLWSKGLAHQIYEIAEKCLELRKRRRPALMTILPEIEKLQLLPDQ